MSDIIERLRAAVPTYEGTPIAWPCEVRSELLLEAAAEVEKLTRERDEARAEVERLRAENARLRAQVDEYFRERETHPVEET